MLRTVQIGLNTSDIAGSLQLFSEAFGFKNAGAQALWGPLMEVQGFDTTARTLLWWMVGRQPLFQLELFHHTEPKQRRLPWDWRPCDHGWGRVGIAVADHEDALKYLAGKGLAPINGVATIGDVRSFAFRDPYVGCVVEVIQDSAVVQERAGLTPGDGPAIAYVASSVSDIDSARHFYREVVGYDIAPLELLHQPQHEALWGLEGAERNGFLAYSGEIFLEILEYRSPVGRPRRPDYLPSDQGIVNVAVGSRNPGEVEAVIDRSTAVGVVPPRVVGDSGVLAAYLIDADRELELFSFPQEMDDFLGFGVSPNPLLPQAIQY